MLYSFCLQINTSTRSCECQLQQVMVSLVSPVPLSCSRSSFSPGILCILSVLCNASLQLRQAGSSVFLLHRSAAGLLCECVWGEKRQWEREKEKEREYVLPVCMCVCQSVLQSSVAMATLGTWLRQLCSPALPESCCRKPLCLCSGKMHTHTHTQTPFSMWNRQTDWRTDWV